MGVKAKRVKKFFVKFGKFLLQILPVVLPLVMAKKDSKGEKNA